MRRRLILPIHSLYGFYRLRMMSDRAFIEWQYKRAFGVLPDLRNPRTFSEKMQWLKLNDRTPLPTICADKYAVRQFVADRIGERYLIPLLAHTKNPDDITPDALPDPPYIIKTTHDSSGGIIVRDPGAEDWNRIRTILRKLLRWNYYHTSKEWQYRDIPPAIIVERLLGNESGHVPDDLKIWCFHGKPAFTHVITGRESVARAGFFDTDWRPIDMKRYYPPLEEEMPEPAAHGEMLEIAEKLSSDFPFARVDLYDVGGRIYFGEITFHPGGGFSAFEPAEWDHHFGAMLHLDGEPSAARTDGASRV